jgi:hypothetical protein
VIALFRRFLWWLLRASGDPVAARKLEQLRTVNEIEQAQSYLVEVQRRLERAQIAAIEAEARNRQHIDRPSP